VQSSPGSPFFTFDIFETLELMFAKAHDWDLEMPKHSAVYFHPNGGFGETFFTVYKPRFTIMKNGSG